MSKKLAQAVAENKVVVKNCSSGEVSLRIVGKAYIIGPNQSLNLTSITSTAKQCMAIGGLKELLAAGMLEIV